MNKDRVDRRKQKVKPRSAEAQAYHQEQRAIEIRRVEAEQAFAGNPRGTQAANKLQAIARAHLRKPVVYMKGGDLQYPRPGRREQQDYARWSTLRDILRSDTGDPPYASDAMRYFQKVYTPDGSEFVLRSHIHDDISDAVEKATKLNTDRFGWPPEWLPSARLTNQQVKDAIDRRRRKLRNIKGGDIVIRDALFRELPDRGRRMKGHKKQKLTHPFYYERGGKFFLKL